MDGAELELERRSKFLSSLIQKKKAIEQQDQTERLNVKVRASDMPLALQNKAFKCARDQLDYMPGKLDSKRLALALKKEFDSTYGPAWHCIVGTSFGSYVTHSLGVICKFHVYIVLSAGFGSMTRQSLVQEMFRDPLGVSQQLHFSRTLQDV
ncbi:hypothetical protein V6N12_006107 [Hibiscus sabdariffa]|uniref:Dynein light chain n=1 Tax=Hibiscus sabdariffa TaxID=183260 RepID=A0ABR2EX12_9ROSI